MALYLDPHLQNLYTYQGTSPYTDGALYKIPNSNQLTGMTEGWVAAVDQNNWGMGIYAPNMFANTSFVYGDPSPYVNVWAPQDSDVTTYISPRGMGNIGPKWNLYTESCVMLDSLTNIRIFVYNNRVYTNGTWNFDTGIRESWSFVNTADSPNPSGGYLTFIPRSSCSYIYSPPCAINGDTKKIIKIRMKNNTPSNSMDFYWMPAKSSSVSPTNFDNLGNLTNQNYKRSITIDNTGAWNEYTIDMTNEPGWSGVINYMAIAMAGNNSSNVSIDYIKTYTGSAGAAPTVSNVS